MTVYNEDNAQEIAELLVGRKVVAVEFQDRLHNAKGILTLDDGTVLELEGNDGGCACDAGCYPLTALNRVDNVITKVELHNSPDGDGLQGEGVYQIFVFAGDERINLATFTGSDGNGYYGTGFSIKVRRPE